MCLSLRRFSFWAFTCLYPVFKGFELSFYDWNLGTPMASRKFVGWENFVWAWQDPAVFNSMKVTAHLYRVPPFQPSSFLAWRWPFCWKKA